MRLRDSDQPKTIIAAIREYWHNHRLVNSLGTKSINARTGAPFFCFFVFDLRCYSLSQRHTWRFYTPIAANLIANENRKRFSPPIDADKIADRGDVAVLKSHVVKSPNLMGWLY